MDSQQINSGDEGTEGSRFSITEVSGATGIPEDVIEHWERDFGVVAARGDAPGEKTYSQTDIDRLRAINTLASESHEVSEIARLSLADLRACLGKGDPDESLGASSCRLVVVGAQIEALVREPGGIGSQAEVVGFYANFKDWIAGQDDNEADLILLDCPSLFPETVEAIVRQIEGSSALRAVVIFQFLKSDTLKLIEQSSNRISAMRAPVTARDLKEACEADLALAAIRSSSLAGSEFPAISESANVSPIQEQEEGEIPPRQFSDFQLSKISQISTAINCECPHHLASLLTALNAFEQYSRDCENRNAEDAALHAYLHRRTARAREIMEDALSVLAEAEGIRVD